MSRTHGVLTTALACALILNTTACIGGEYDEPTEWLEARYKAEELFTAEGDLAPALEALDDMLTTTEDSVAIALITETSISASGSSAEASGPDFENRRKFGSTSAQTCPQYSSYWPVYQDNINFKDAELDKEILKRKKLTLTALMIPATQVMRELLAESGQVRGIIGEEGVNVLEQAAGHLTEKSLHLKNAQTLDDLDLATLDPSDLDEAVSTAKKVRIVLSAEGASDLDLLVKMIAEYRDALAKDAARKDGDGQVDDLLETFATDPNQACGFLGLDLQSSIHLLQKEYLLVSSILRTKHDTAKNSVGNIR